MAAPSNIRINPFIGDGGTTNYVDFTEVHIIPAVSPFVVRLNEVPQKKDPSNMKVIYVNETTGAPTTTVLTEVAATPGAGEFRPDYSTNANGDEDWNTGLIEFSSADAGKSIQVSYTGMGTLAGVKNNRFPSWWLDRGDGSDGDFRPTGNVTINGLKQYRSVFIPAGVTVTVSQWAKIHCHGAFINLGTVSSVGQGMPASVAGTASSGGSGGRQNSNYGVAGGGKLIGFDSNEYSSIMLGAGGGSGGGSGGGYGGRGSGDIVIVCRELKNHGIINATGETGGAGAQWCGGGGGGGGGRVMIIADILLNSGKVLANGGTGGASGGSNGSVLVSTAGAAGAAGQVIIKEIGVM